jgi:hypothetical protein
MFKQRGGTMKQDQNAIQRLESARQSVHAELGSIQPAGRLLTPEEKRKLDVLTAAETNVNEAIDHLTGSVTNKMIPIPADGRYNAGNDVLFMVLRIDLKVARMVSADLFATANGHREYVASLRSNPGVAVTSGNNPLAVVIEDRDARQARGWLTFHAVTGSEITLDLLVDDQILALPVGRPTALTGRLVDSRMRELGIEMETEMGIEPLPSWEFEGRIITVESCLEDAGFNVFNAGFRDQFPSPSSGKWDTSELHGLMRAHAQEPLDRKSWNLHLLMVRESTLDGLLGIMFDNDDADLNELPRQGAAIFQKLIRTYPNWEQKLIQTTVHELGHALNLAHRFERSIGRADSTSFMNYDWKYLGGNNRGKFWRDFAFEFDPDELAFLRHGPRAKIIPGGARFHTVPYWENPDGGYVPYIPEVPSDDFKITLVPPPAGVIFQFAQPVLLTVQLTNFTGRPMEIPRFVLDPKAGMLEFIIKRRRSPVDNTGSHTGFVFRPIVHRCFNAEQAASDLVPPGQNLTENVNLTFGSAGFTFVEPGEYAVQAVFVWQKARQEIRTIKSNVLTIRIAYPKSAAEERDGQYLFRRDVGYYFALGGSDALSAAEDILNEIAQRRQLKAKAVTDPLVANIVRCKAINLTRDFVTYADGKYSVRRADPEKARTLFESIEKISQKIFDPQTCRTTLQTAKSLHPGDAR